MVTPFRTIAPVPIQTRSPICTGALIGRSTPPTVSRWKSLSSICTSHDSVHSAPMVTSSATRILVRPLTFVAWPMVSRPLSTTTRTPRWSETTPAQCSSASGRTRISDTSALVVSPNGPSPTRSAAPGAKVIRSLPSITVLLPIQIGWRWRSG